MAVDLSQSVPDDIEDRFKLVLEMATESDVLSVAMKAELKAMLDPVNLAMIVGVLVVWAGSHAFGVGLIFDVIMLGASIFMVGWSAWEAAQQIAEFLEKTVRAKTMHDLKIASTLLATAIAILSVKMFARIISKGASGATSGGRSRKSSVHAKVEEPPPKRNTGKSSSSSSKQPASAQGDGPDSKKKNGAPAEKKSPPDVILARQKTAKDFFTKNMGLKDHEANDLMKGIDFDKPVELVKVPPPDTMSQYVRKSHGKPGNWFNPDPKQTPDMLGLNGDPSIRELKTFKTPEGFALKSTASPIVDNWTDGSKAVSTSGGGFQMTVSDEMKNAFQEVH